MKLNFIGMLFTALFLTSVHANAPASDAEKLAELYTKDTGLMVRNLLVNNYSIRDPIVLDVFVDEITILFRAYFAEEYARQIAPNDLKKINEILNTPAGKSLLKANKEIGERMARDTQQIMQPIQKVACTRASGKLTSNQMAWMSSFCK